MTVETSVKKYRELLTKRCEAMKMQLDLEMEIQVFEKEMQLLNLVSSPRKHIDQSKTQQFIEQNESKLEPEDIEFLHSEYRLVGEVVARTEISASTIKRLADSGKITEGPKTKAGYRQFSTLSVMEYLLSDPDQEA